MLVLTSKKNHFSGWDADTAPRVLRVTSNALLPPPRAKDHALLARECDDLDGTWQSRYGAILINGESPSGELPNSVALDQSLYALKDGDVIRLSPRDNSVKVLYRRDAAFNALLVTERCNSFCLMCSQPPRDIDDSHLVGEILRTIELADRQTPEICLTGGEPTLLGDDFFRIIKHACNFLPDTALHVLTNGRRFKDPTLAQALGKTAHPDLMLGIPLYSEQPDRHDFVVQSVGAFDETVKGLLNLAQAGIRIELRVVLHSETYKGLPALAEFVARNLPFVHHVALMGLELTGFAKANLNALWVDPYDYRAELERAVRILERGRVAVNIFNHQLCVVPPSIRHNCVRSISDWKNEYLPVCEDCSLKSECGGFFGTGMSLQRYSDHISPITGPEELAAS